ncbi:MAG: Hsp20/alpha crystallin family protein [Patescibacteria group bacterium]|nr:Hsp20/alpha crystallin family protein [Patescibacteria group bacterium]
MDIIKWSPFRDIDKFFDQDDFFPVIPAISRKSKPAIDIYQTKEDVVAEVALAGVDPNDVKVSVEDDVLTVKGEMKKEKETKEKDYYCKEIRSGSFMRSMSLPSHVKADRAQAESKNGVLKITIPKDERKMLKEIPIKIVNKK